MSSTFSKFIDINVNKFVTAKLVQNEIINVIPICATKSTAHAVRDSNMKKLTLFHKPMEMTQRRK